MQTLASLNMSVVLGEAHFSYLEVYVMNCIIIKSLLQLAVAHNKAGQTCLL